MMYLKVMSEYYHDDASEHCDYSVETIPDNAIVSFIAGHELAVAEKLNVCACIEYADGSIKSILLRGKAYLMNANGKTIAQRSPWPVPSHAKVETPLHA
jgi:hypothetical protein